jgi:hypothetical protein
MSFDFTANNVGPWVKGAALKCPEDLARLLRVMDANLRQATEDALELEAKRAQFFADKREDSDEFRFVSELLSAKWLEVMNLSSTKGAIMEHARQQPDEEKGEGVR